MTSKKAYVVLMVVLSLLAATNASARHRHTHARRARRSSRHIRRLVWHPMFPGSHEMLVRQNQQLDVLELPRIADEEELVAREEDEELVPVEDEQGLSVAANLPENRHYCKPWTRDFLEDLGEAYYHRFHRPILVTSLVRTAEQQKALRRHNRNAAPVEGDTTSTHLTGVSADILKRGMSRQQYRWLEQYLLPLKQAGLVDPIEERRQPVFHIVVFNTYSGSKYIGDDGGSGQTQDALPPLGSAEAPQPLESQTDTPQQNSKIHDN